MQKATTPTHQKSNSQKHAASFKKKSKTILIKSKRRVHNYKFLKYTVYSGKRTQEGNFPRPTAL